MRVRRSKELSDDILAATDVLYVTRIQKERFEEPSEYDRLKGSFVISNDTLSKMKPSASVMHPLPRVCCAACSTPGHNVTTPKSTV